ncbi:MAG: Asp-tRNA(Asn)/Glu-tRNA(Gln) amidotransferase subunit GatC [Firmicutes bacterium]|nr:Asp-tRNA(Asn)/Glu-tRNA(Gln) amidotransferase subunit GatC [Bacillota bacterium]
MSVVTREEIEHIAHLARLAFGPDELDRFTDQLNRILGHVARLSDLDTSAAPPTSSVLNVAQAPLRDDEPWRPVRREEVLEAAPSSERGFFKVPKVVE